MNFTNDSDTENTLPLPGPPDKKLYSNSRISNSKSLLVIGKQPLFTSKSYTRRPKAKNLRLPELMNRNQVTEFSVENKSIPIRNRSLTQRTVHNSTSLIKNYENTKTLGKILGPLSPKLDELNLLFLKRRINNNLVTVESSKMKNFEKHIIYRSYNKKKVNLINPFMKEEDSNGSNLLNMTTDKKIFSRLKRKVDQVQLLKNKLEEKDEEISQLREENRLLRDENTELLNMNTDRVHLNPYDTDIHTVDQITQEIDKNRGNDRSLNTLMMNTFLGEVAKLKEKNKKIMQKLEEYKKKSEVFEGKYEECLEIISKNNYKVYNDKQSFLSKSRSKSPRTPRILKSPLNLNKMSFKLSKQSEISNKKDRISNIKKFENSKHSAKNQIKNTSLDELDANDYLELTISPKYDKFNQVSSQTLTQTQTEKLKKINNGSNNLNLIFNKCLRTDRKNKVLKDLDDLARGICKTLSVGTTEICIIDDNVLDLFEQTEKYPPELQEEFLDLGRVVTIRYGLEFGINRTNKPSNAYNCLKREYYEIQQTKNPIFRNDALYLPILRTWREKDNFKVIGCVILSNFTNEENSKISKGFKLIKRETLEEQSKLKNKTKKETFRNVKRENNSIKLKRNGPNKKLLNSGYLRDIVSNISYFFNLCILDMSYRKKEYNFHAMSDLMKIFKFDTDIRNSLCALRYHIPKIFLYEDCALLVKDLDQMDTFYAISPNVDGSRLLEVKKSDLFFYHPQKSISSKLFNNSEILSVKYNPRSDPDFVEGIDNLTPVVNLKEILYVNLGTSKKNSLGVLQLVNKTKGNVNKEEEKLISTVGNVVGNFLRMILVNLEYKIKFDDLMASYEHVKQVVNSDLFKDDEKHTEIIIGGIKSTQ